MVYNNYYNRQNFLLAYISLRMAILYRTAKFKSANIPAIFGAQSPNLIPANSTLLIGYLFLYDGCNYRVCAQANHRYLWPHPQSSALKQASTYNDCNSLPDEHLRLLFVATGIKCSYAPRFELFSVANPEHPMGGGGLIE